MAWCGTPPAATEWLLAWNTSIIQAFGLLSLLLAGMAFTAHRWRFLVGWGILAVAFVSPLCALTAALFSARAFHHLLLALVAAPLFALAFPARRAHGVTAAGGAFLMIMWLWFWPPAYVAAYDSVAVYWAMQVSMLGSAIWFWRAALAPATDTLSALVGIGAVSGAMGLLGGLLTFAPLPLYAPHLMTTGSFGLDALQDQQLGGLLMWVPGMLPFALAGILLARSRFRAQLRDATP